MSRSCRAIDTQSRAWTYARAVTAAALNLLRAARRTKSPASTSLRFLAAAAGPLAAARSGRPRRTRTVRERCWLLREMLVSVERVPRVLPRDPDCPVLCPGTWRDCPVLCPGTWRECPVLCPETWRDCAVLCARGLLEYGVLCPGTPGYRGEIAPCSAQGQHGEYSAQGRRAVERPTGIPQHAPCRRDLGALDPRGHKSPGGLGRPSRAMPRSIRRRAPRSLDSARRGAAAALLGRAPIPPSLPGPSPARSATAASTLRPFRCLHGRRGQPRPEGAHGDACGLRLRAEALACMVSRARRSAH
jgi:hypothetical protein